MATIKARRWWNKTPFYLETGKTYRFSASGTWIDWTHKASATGFYADKLESCEKWRREPDAKWFSAIGRINKKKNTQFDIGKLLEGDTPYTATASGVLYCFANDVRFMYWNNKGAIDLQVEEL